ncbi:MAG: Trypsin-like peptidase domain [Candidatus Parcubacteria bacterium]
MQFIIDLAVAGLLAYLSFTNYLAAGVASLLGEEPIVVEVESTTDTPEETVETPTALTKIESLFASIPDILLQSAAYQQATVIDSVITPDTATVTDPIDAIVNIYCTFTTNRSVRTTTGTGFFVGNTGVIMTNAHVAQFLLLEETSALGDANCIVRNGSPAAPRYVAELLYIPPSWIKEHANMIDAESPSGTGERDYALLYVSDTVDGSLTPNSFPGLKIASRILSEDVTAPVTAAGYPAGTPGLNTSTNLLAVKATTSISELFTFGSNQPDVLALRGSTMGQQGSSGGPILSKNGEVIGMIATRGNDQKDGSGSLRAITIHHVNRTLKEETGVELLEHTQGDVSARAGIFTATMAPFLTALLTAEIN